MVEQNPRTSEKVVAFPVIYRDPVTVDFGDSIRAARVERGGFRLGHFLHLAKHLTAGCLVKANLGVDQTDRVQNPRDTEGRKFACQHRLFERCGDERLCGQVIHLIRLDFVEDVNQRDLIE